MSNAPTITLSIAGMSCASCVGRVQQALAAVPGVASAEVNLATETARITGTAELVQVAQVAQAARDAGYPPHEVKAEFSILNMTCASCVGRVERALRAVPGVADAAENLASQTARVRFLDGVVAPAALIAAVAGVVYQASLVEATDHETTDMVGR